MLFLTVSDWWMALERSEQIFWIIALVFTVLMLIQFILTLTGLDFHGESAELHGDTATLDHDHDFSIFSIRSIIAFFAFLGWTGVLMLGAGISLWLALVLGLVMGGIAMFLVAYLIYWFSRLGQEDNITIHEALYQTGEVYLLVPAGRSGKGRVTVKTRNVMREWDAMTEGPAIATGTKVLVVDLLPENALLVTPADE